MPANAFSAHFFEARMKFREAALALDLEVETLHNPHTLGPDGEELSADLVTLGEKMRRIAFS